MMDLRLEASSRQDAGAGSTPRAAGVLRGLSLLVATFVALWAVYSVVLVQDMQSARRGLEAHVGVLQRVHGLSRSLTPLQESLSRGRHDVEALEGMRTARRELVEAVALLDADPELAGELDAALEQAGTIEGRVAAPVFALEEQLDALTSSLRARTGALSVELGSYWDRLTGLMVGAVLIALAHLGLLLRAERGRRRALDLAQELRTTAHVLATAEAELRNRERLAELNRELRTARDEALAASRAKSAFQANLSHQLHTPLSQIMGYTELLLEEADDDDPPTLSQRQRDIRSIHQAAQALRRDLADVVSLTQLELGEIQLHPSHFPLRPALEEARSAATSSAGHCDSRLRVECPASLELTHDRARLVQLLTELLHHALQRAPGEVRLRAGLTEHNGVLITVQDDGSGLDDETCAALFEPFHLTQGPGLGLGLPVCRQLGLLMGGSLAVGEHEAGLEVRLHLPLQ